MPEKITFTMIKPAAVEDGNIGPILNMIHERGFRISAMKMLQLTKNDAEEFYSIHKERPFYDSLVDFMSSGPIVAIVLEKENAVEDYRQLIGSTDPNKAEEGTVRKRYARSMQQNAVHGSDSDENARIEAGFFFPDKERF
jgi:nucleoside-diphosphate kinase